MINVVFSLACRYIYWSYNLYNIDRSLMDGSQKERIVEGLFVPVAITISQKERRIYWVDEGPGYSYRYVFTVLGYLILNILNSIVLKKRRQRSGE